MRRGSVANRVLDYYVGVPAINFLSSFRRTHKFPAVVRNIGVMVAPAHGDTLLASGPIRDLRTAFPSQRIIFFADPANLAAARLLPSVDEVRLVRITEPQQTIRSMSEADLDLMVDFTPWQRLTAFYSLKSGARFTVGFRTKGQHRHRCYDRVVEHRRDRHELENLRALVASLGIRVGSEPQVIIPEVEEHELHCSRDRELIVFHPWSGTRKLLREWPQDRWLELARRLQRPGRSFVVTGSPADATHAVALCERLVDEGLPANPFIGHRGLGSVAALLSRARVLVSVNTGVMHLGAIVGAPTVSINGPTSSARYGPIGTNAADVDTEDGSGGYLDLGFEFKNQDPNTMRKITVEQVVDAVQRVTQGSSSTYRAHGLKIGAAPAVI